MISDCLLVDPLGDFLVSGLFDHRRKPRLELLQSPADRVFHALIFHVVNRMFTEGVDMIISTLAKLIAPMLLPVKLN
jgi:hypothetical protein